MSSENSVQSENKFTQYQSGHWQGLEDTNSSIFCTEVTT